MWPGLREQEDGSCAIGELSEELIAELTGHAIVLEAVETAETGERSEMHSGGTVVDRWIAVLGGACPGGLTVLDKALR